MPFYMAGLNHKDAEKRSMKSRIKATTSMQTLGYLMLEQCLLKPALQPHHSFQHEDGTARYRKLSGVCRLLPVNRE